MKTTWKGPHRKTPGREATPRADFFNRHRIHEPQLSILVSFGTKMGYSCNGETENNRRGQYREWATNSGSSAPESRL